MTGDRARALLRRLLRSFTPGGVLRLLAELHHESAEQARRKGDAVVRERHGTVQAALFVVGLGLDAACPR